jgi:hypothetical protein
MLATANLIPSQDLPDTPWYIRLFTWTPYYFFIDGRGRWFEPFKKTALDIYKSVCEATATYASSFSMSTFWNRHFLFSYPSSRHLILSSGNERKIRELTTAPYQSQRLKLIRRHFSRPSTTSKSSPRQHQEPTFKWTLHSLPSPPRIVSIRAVDAMMDPVMPKTGSRLLVHVCIRLESIQVCRNRLLNFSYCIHCLRLCTNFLWGGAFRRVFSRLALVTRPS